MRVWYISKIGEGLFPADLTAEQQTIKTTIETMIQKGSTKPEDSLVDCSVLNAYESVFNPAAQNDESSSGEKSGDTEEGEDGEEESEKEEDVEVDETEMSDDDTDSEYTDDIDDVTSEEMAARRSSGAAKDTAAAQPALSSWWRKCRRQRSNRSAVSCVLVNTVTFRCFLLRSVDSATNADISVKLDDTVDGAKENTDKSEGDNFGLEDGSEVTTDPEALPLARVKKLAKKNKSGGEEPTTEESVRNEVEKATKNTDDDTLKKLDKPTSGGKESSKYQDVSGSHSSETSYSSAAEDKPKAGNIDIVQFEQMIEKRASEYMLKIQTMETQVMRLENELLMEKLNKQNHSSTFSRLENQILKLENELLKMTLSYDELREENEKILKKQKSFLELDYVKRPGDFQRLPDNSSKQFELISQHQSKISELTDHLRNQSHLIDKIKGQSDSLEDQNRMLFQIVMNQTMLISQMMKKVESLSDSNLKHHMQQQLITDKLGIALASGDVMDTLNALVSDKFPLGATDVSQVKTSNSGAKRSSVTSGSAFVSLSQCNHPTRNRAFCGFNSVLLSQCLMSENYSVAPNTSSNVPRVVAEKFENNKTGNAPDDTFETSDTASQDRKTGDSAGSVKSDKEDNTKWQTNNDDDGEGQRKEGRQDRDGDMETRHETGQKVTEETADTEKLSDKTASSPNVGEKTNSTEKQATIEKKIEKKATSEEEAADETISGKSTPPKQSSDSKTKKKTASKKSDDKDKGAKKKVSKKKSGKAKESKKKKANKADSKKAKVDRIPPLYNAGRRAEPKGGFLKSVIQGKVLNLKVGF